VRQIAQAAGEQIGLFSKTLAGRAAAQVTE